MSASCGARWCAALLPAVSASCGARWRAALLPAVSASCGARWCAVLLRGRSAGQLPGGWPMGHGSTKSMLWSVSEQQCNVVHEALVACVSGSTYVEVSSVRILPKACPGPGWQQGMCLAGMTHRRQCEWRGLDSTRQQPANCQKQCHSCARDLAQAHVLCCSG
jgi:hypothetical protein